MMAPTSEPALNRQLPIPMPRTRHDNEVFDIPDPRFAHAHVDILGVRVSAINLEQAVNLAEQWVATRNPGYICVTGVHGVIEAQSDPELRQILNNAVINTPDGMPMTWVGRLKGFRDMDRVYGPDFMMAMCRLSVERGYRSFLYGGKPGIAQLLSETLKRRFPGLQVVGTYTPPFRDLTLEEEQEVIAQVRASGAQVVWVGLSTPRQERFMAQLVDALQVPLLVGVGAAFDYHTGQIKDCSMWVKRSGLQWLHRLLQDPRRLWKRYLRNNPAFIWKISCQLLGFRK